MADQRWSYRIRGWSKFQHFKDRRPPWIKLYRDLLDDVDWHELDGDSAKALISIWLIASENDGHLPDIKKLAFRLRMSEKACLSSCSKLSHYLEQVDIEPISSRHQVGSPETETETETEGETEAQGRGDAAAPPAARASRSGPKGSRWPSDAVVSEDWIVAGESYREVANMPPIDLRAEALKFQNYWSSKSGAGAIKVDWKRTWLNWTLTAKGTQNGSRLVRNNSQLEQLLEIVATDDKPSGVDW